MTRALDDRGFTLVESIVAMFLLLLLAVSLLPVLIQGLRQSSSNAALVSATSLASQSIEDARAQKSCAALPATNTTTTAGTGTQLQTVRTVGSCPASYPGTIAVTVTVTRLDTNVTEVSANTLVYLTGP
ncbi:prepilin-type N-terminal cleavage/methylation domain-containing protein [Galbitalea soli]|uniref:Prepilin-type N-terminal cleavage/methylation domain-containing protein n=1 Tax=Galbitalea soli TaxID=1268042 RepID=A0A7C9TPY7_9MICO|nr:prepilin-type N-terminal cleavage/methylation domain-containing protein [Galbitalea soli]NEM90855.1 prepilin-type N-terminal cleavage/methylation domain-containing protein [Galbitalea soli]NYJ31575.1 prepilin-type N-terminal cleavage/methylation domain-containing protein [Galbitalea soli]